MGDNIQCSKALPFRCGVLERTNTDCGGSFEGEETLETNDGWGRKSIRIDVQEPIKSRNGDSPVRTPQAGCQSSS